MDSHSNHSQRPVRIELNSQALAQAIANRTIAISDIRCLDARSKQQVWRTCLELCLRD